MAEVPMMIDLLGGDMAEVKRLRLEPDDILCVFLQFKISREAAQRLRKELEKVVAPFGLVNRVLIFDDGMHLGVLSPSVRAQTIGVTENPEGLD